MAIEGVDFSWGRPSPQALVKAGKRFVCRYIGNFGGKSCTRAELDTYTRAGLAVVLNYEASGTELKGGRDAGVNLGKVAQAAASALGYPDAVIYFSADWDASEVDQAKIHATLDGIATVIPRARIGLYGGYYVIERAAKAGKASFFWQTYAWSGGHVSSHAHLYQWWNSQSIDGAAVDYTRALKSAYGQVGAASAPASTGYQPGDITVDRSVKWVQQRLTAHGYSVGPHGVDDQMGAGTIAALYEFQGDQGITKDAIVGSVTEARLAASPAPKKPVKPAKPAKSRGPKPTTPPKYPLPSGSYFGPEGLGAQSVSGWHSHRADLKRWQQRMADRGWNITVDGLYGPEGATTPTGNTAFIAGEFQKEKGLQVDNLIGPETWKAAWTEPVT
ncbi:glycoside hydrolase domain-containing protein [Microbacterium sp. KR10-403]|uniref:glycoside hydrolase domain-containing protein n=1 Tax=Microbacterium sp. KR10-403 TaxID=3158581 RepID=UPI0032E3C4A6